jgi:hypothetical protein
MALLYLTSEQEIRQRALADAIARVPYSDEAIETTLARADKILAWYTRAADTQEIRD